MIIKNDVLDLNREMKRSFAELILSRAHKYGKKVAMINAETRDRFTYADILRDAHQIACSLYYDHGLRKGDVVLISTETRPETLIFDLGALLIGLVLTTADSNYPQRELKMHIENSGAQYALASQFNAHTIKNAVDESSSFKKVFVLGECQGCTSYNALLGCCATRELPEVGFDCREDVAVMLSSSGTTGPSKLLRHTHYALMYDALRSQNHCVGYFAGADHDTTMLWPMSIYSGWGFNFNMLALFTGACVVHMKKFDMNKYMDAISEYKPNLLALNTPMFKTFAKDNAIKAPNFHNVEGFVYAGSPVSENIIKMFHNKFAKQQVIQVYGATEVFTISATPVAQGTDNHYGSAGKLYPGMEMRVIDIETGQDCGPEKSGEILVRGHNMMQGYHRNQQATEHAIDAQGWFHTGDFGHVDKDEYIYITERLKDVIAVGSFMVSPSEIEGILLDHPEVAECGVIAMKDGLFGEVPTAVIVLTPGATVTEQEIVQFIEGEVQPVKRLKGGAFFVDAIPKNGSGKILRRKIREELKQKNKYAQVIEHDVTVTGLNNNF